MLDPHPANLLGKGILDPGTEDALLSAGIVFATQRTAYPVSGKPFVFLITSRRPYTDILNQRTVGRAMRTTRTPVSAA